MLDVGKLATADIAFGSNSWRGDRFEASLDKGFVEEVTLRGQDGTPTDSMFSIVVPRPVTVVEP